MICVWEKIIIPEIKNINIVITELYNCIHYLSILLDQHISLKLLYLQYGYDFIIVFLLIASFISLINIYIIKLD